jgi:hypothetical protein
VPGPTGARGPLGLWVGTYKPLFRLGQLKMRVPNETPSSCCDADGADEFEDQVARQTDLMNARPPTASLPKNPCTDSIGSTLNSMSAQHCAPSRRPESARPVRGVGVTPEPHLGPCADRSHRYGPSIRAARADARRGSSRISRRTNPQRQREVIHDAHEGVCGNA